MGQNPTAFCLGAFSGFRLNLLVAGGSSAVGSCINGVAAGWWPLTSRVPSGSFLGLVLSSVLINDLDAGLECILSKFEGDTKLGAVDSLKGGEALKRELNKLRGPGNHQLQDYKENGNNRTILWP